MSFEGRLVSYRMRSMASTTFNEQGWDPELIEVALAHVDKDKVRSAYNRADYIERRRPMMIWWSEHIQKAATGSLSVSATQEKSRFDTLTTGSYRPSRPYPAPKGY